MGPLAGALRSSVNRQIGYTHNRLMLGREVHIPATLVYHPPPSASSQNGEDSDEMVDNDNPQPEVNDNQDPVDQYVASLHERMTTAHTLARKQLETAQKVMKRSHEVRRRRNTSSVVSKKESTSSTKASDAHKDKGAYQGTRGRAKAATQSTDRTDSHRTDVKYRVKPETRPPMRRDSQRRSVPDSRPPLGRDNRADAIHTRRHLESETRRAPTRRRNTPRPIYCVCKTRNPRGYMVQCDACADWFHPRCVGITNEYAHRVPRYYCPYCEPVQVTPGRLRLSKA